jgi:ribonuclease D
VRKFINQKLKSSHNIITKNQSFEKIEYNIVTRHDSPETIALDTETTGLTPRNCDIFCVQIGTGTNNYIIHMYDDIMNF